MDNNSRIYHQNDFAYAIACHDCRDIQLGFGNVVFQFTPREFIDLKSQIAKTYEDNEDMECKGCRNIIIRTPLSNMAFRFNYYELSELMAVMRNTEMILEVERIIGIQ